MCRVVGVVARVLRVVEGNPQHPWLLGRLIHSPPSSHGGFVFSVRLGLIYPLRGPVDDDVSQKASFPIIRPWRLSVVLQHAASFP